MAPRPSMQAVDTSAVLPDKHIVCMIIELVQNKSFTLIIGCSKHSRLRRLKNRFTQGSIQALLLFNIYYINDWPPSPSRSSPKLTDYLAIFHSSEEWKKLER